MTRSLTTRAAFGWLGLLVLGFVNGATREILLKQVLGITEPLAHQLSCLTGVILWTMFTWTIWGKLRIGNRTEALRTGAGWFFATFLFETFVLNRNMSWNEILQTYNVAAGEFWGLALLWIGLMPILILRFRSGASAVVKP